jgi:hypothetical protein
MAQTDTIAVSIPESDLAEIRASIATQRGKLMPHLKTLNAQERIELPKMGDKTVAFVQKALEYGQQNRELVPNFLDLGAMATDAKAVQTLRELAQGLNPIAEALNDSMTLSGSEAYQGALVFYSNVKNAAKVKAPNAGSIYDDLSSRFPGATTKKKA